MKTVDEEKQHYGQIVLKEEQEEDNHPVHRWMWVRRFILCIILITLFMQSLAPIYYDEEIFIAQDINIKDTNEKSHLVLHTGFPPTQNISGLPIFAGKSAATAFSPNPSNANVKRIALDEVKIEGGESWWDRLFPNRHVHLVNVQLPVVPLDKDSKVVEATLSICASKKQRFGLGRPQIPDMNNCVETALLKTEEMDIEDEFGVLEWVPEVTIVLQKSKLYWLVVQTPSDPFSWVYSQSGSNELGTAFETEVGWEFKLEGEPIPSAMIMVEDHHKE